MKILKALLLLIWLSSYFTENQTDDPSTLWFGYYQEDGASNPEDPMPGFVYLNIPNDGTFEGELFFSYAGCDGTFDVGRVSGTVSEGKITGNWEGMVDGKAVGGKYNGTLNAAKNSYRGTYTNANGKQEIPCGDMGGYYVAPHGTWSIKGNDSQGDFCCGTEILAEEEYAQFTWEEIPNADVYRYVIIDKLCLMEKMNLEECLVLTGESVWPDMEYNEGDNRPVKPLVKGRTYVISVYALSEEGEVLNDGSYEFLYK